jgi:retron-type reverse transcriptase
LLAGKYQHGGYEAFNINDSKPRSIHKARVRDRLVHHAIYRVLYPLFDRKFISDSYSCREGKGTHKAIAQFRKYARGVSQNGTKTCWILKCDIRKFFANIDHEVLLGILRRDIQDQKILSLLENVISSFSAADTSKGLPLGNLTSQLLVNVYMNEFDHFAKQRLRIKHYVRYADDFVVLSSDKQKLEAILTEFRSFLRYKLKLEIHPNKVSIETFASGVDFLGWVHFPNHTILRTATKRRMIVKMNKSESESTRQSYLGMLQHGDTHELKKRILLNSKIPRLY